MGPTSEANVVTPVRLPPGRLTLTTSPSSIGPLPHRKRIRYQSYDDEDDAAVAAALDGRAGTWTRLKLIETYVAFCANPHFGRWVRRCRG